MTLGMMILIRSGTYIALNVENVFGFCFNISMCKVEYIIKCWCNF